MASHSNNNPFLGFIVAVVAALFVFFYGLFAPSHPTASSDVKSQQVILGNGTFTNPSEIQNPAAGQLQRASSLNQNDVNATPTPLP